MKPTATIYQNETEVVVIFSPIKDRKIVYRGASINFDNSWMDGASCGLSGFNSAKELKKFLRDNNYVKKGSCKLGIYCWSTHTIKNGATLTCIFKHNHKGKHSANYEGSFISKRDDGVYKW